MLHNDAAVPTLNTVNDTDCASGLRKTSNSSPFEGGGYTVRLPTNPPTPLRLPPIRGLNCGSRGAGRLHAAAATRWCPAPRTMEGSLRRSEPIWGVEGEGGGGRDVLERLYTVGGGGVPPPGPSPLLPFQCLRLAAKNLLRRLWCQEDVGFNIFGPPSAGTTGGIPAKPPSQPPFKPPLPRLRVHPWLGGRGRGGEERGGIGGMQGGGG